MLSLHRFLSRRVADPRLVEPLLPDVEAAQLSFFGRARRLFREHERVTIEDLLAIADEKERTSCLFAMLNFRIVWALRHDRTSRDYAQAASYFEFKELNRFSWGTPVKPAAPRTFFGRARRLFREHERVTIEDLLAIADEKERTSCLFAMLNFRIVWALRHDRTSRDYAQAASYFDFNELNHYSWGNPIKQG